MAAARPSSAGGAAAKPPLPRVPPAPAVARSGSDASSSSSSSSDNTDAAPRPPARSASCVLLPGVDRRELAARAAQLEADAAAAHGAAQALNKQQRFEEAKAKYAEMRALDAEALRLTRLLGCQECAAAADADSGSDGGAADGDGGDGGDSEAGRAVFTQLHAARPWPEGCDARQCADRALGSVLACLTCDAAATGVQWIYNLDRLAQLLEARRRQAAPPGGSTAAAAAAAGATDVGLEFYDPVQSPFLGGYGSGRNSPYGEQTLLLLRSLAQRAGLDCSAYAELYYKAYSSADDEQEDGQEGAGGGAYYMNASTVAFLRTYSRGLRPPATGADDAQADCVARLAPLVAMFAGDARLMQLVAAATRVTQDAGPAVAWACAGAAVLERLVLRGGGAAAAVQEAAGELRRQAEQQQGRMPIDSQLAAQVAGQLERVLQMRQLPHAQAVEELGRNCHLPNSCQTPLHTVLHHEWLWQHHHHQQQGPQARLVAAVRDALAAGGCCASRAGFAGACLGALLGSDAVPRAWLQRYDAAGEVEEHARAICAARGAL